MTIPSILVAGFGLLAVVAGILLVGQLARLGGRASRPGGGRMAIVQTLALDPRRRLHLVRCDGRHLLLATGGTQDMVVGWLEADSA